MDCRECKTRHRADKLIEEVGGDANAMTFEQMADYIREHKVACPACGSTNFTDIRKFNLMFKTFQGVTEDAKNEIFLRPETAQGIFVNFANIQRTTRRKLPFGVAPVSYTHLDVYKRQPENLSCFGVPEGIRTPDLLVRSQTL